MSTGQSDFDPYYKWLGIRPKDQPPHHYRLLGIDLFESDLEVIEQAADRQMSHLRTFQTGPHSQLSQKLLNDVSAARVTLLSADKKPLYDAALRQQLQAAKPAEPVLVDPPNMPRQEIRPTPIPVTTAPPTLTGPALHAPVPLIDTRSTSRRRRSSPGAALAIVAAVAVVILSGLVFRKWQENQRAEKMLVAHQKPAKDPADSSAPSANEVTTGQPPNPASSVAGAQSRRPRDELPDDPLPNEMAETPPPTVSSDSSTDAGPSKSPPERPAVEKVTAPEPAPRGGAAESPPSLADLTRRLPTPSSAELEAAEQKLTADFGAQTTRAKSASAKADLARELLESSAGATGDAPKQFALMQAARSKAAEAGDVTLAASAIDRLSARFDVDKLAVTCETLAVLAKSAKPPEQAAELVEWCQAVIDEAIDLDCYSFARQACDVAAASARRSKETALAKQFVAHAKNIDELSTNYDALAGAREILVTKPDDPAANLAVGKFLCFSKGAWRRGLEYLKRSNDADLQPLAQNDLAQPFAASAQVVLAGRWWSVAETLPVREQREVRKHAAWWYERALALGQLDEAAVADIKKRLADVALDDPPMVRPGRRIDRIVLWNEHNAGYNNSGTRLCNVILLRRDIEVWRQEGVPVPWAPGQDRSTELPVDRIDADKLRVEVTQRQGNSGGLAEVEVYSGDRNVARGCPAVASQEHRPGDPRSADTLTDGITSSSRENVGYWILPVNREGWAEIDLRSSARRGAFASAGKKENTPSENLTLGAVKKTSRGTTTKLRVTQSMVRKRLRGKASFNAETGELAVVYNFSNKEQLRDFGLSDPARFDKGTLYVAADTTLRHCVEFQTLAVAGQIMLGDLEGEYMRTTSGVTVHGLPRGPAHLRVVIPEKNINWGTSGQNLLAQVALPFEFAVTPSRVNWKAAAYRPLELAGGRFSGPSAAGHLEVCGGRSGNRFSELEIQGTVDPQWANDFFAPRR